MLKRVIFFCYILCLSTVCSAYAIKPVIDRTEIHQGESFHVTFTIKGKYANIEPDFTALNENFTVLGTSTSTQMTIVNSRSSLITDYTVGLLPKQRGRLKIPSIHFGNQVSEPLTINVLAPKQFSNRIKDNRAFIDASVDSKDPYVQSQITYTVRLYYSTNINNYHLTDPHLENAVVFRLGQDKQYQTQLKKKHFQVLERRYAIFPQQSGNTEIQAPVLTGFQIDDRIDYRGFFNLNQAQGKPIKLVAPAIKVSVKKIPSKHSSSNWLPAKKLVLKQSWTHNADDFKVGDPITRTITVTATGLTAAQLPEITIQKNQKTHTYRDKAKLVNGLDRDSVVAKRIEKIAYIPLKAGKLNLPAINVHWWNTDANRAEVAVIPGKSFKVLPSGLTSSITPPAAKPKLIPKQPAQTQTSQPITTQSTPWWIFITIFSLLVGWILTLVAWWYFNRQKHSPNIIVPSLTPQQQDRTQRQCRQRLKQACDVSDIQQAKFYLMQWAQLTWPHDDINNCRTLAIKLGDSDLARACIELDKALYAPRQQLWNGTDLWAAFQAYKRPLLRKATESVIPPLYPDH